MYAIFSIDGEKNPMTVNQFAAFVATAGFEANCVPCIGVYKGASERSFMVSANDFENHLRGSHWIAGQESVLFIAGGNKMECHLEFLASGDELPLGCMKQVDAETAILSGDFTYIPPYGEFYKSGVWYIATDENPDDDFSPCD